jgi:hypothetical protein
MYPQSSLEVPWYVLPGLQYQASLMYVHKMHTQSYRH